MQMSSALRYCNQPHSQLEEKKKIKTNNDEKGENNNLQFLMLVYIILFMKHELTNLIDKSIY